MLSIIVVLYLLMPGLVRICVIYYDWILNNLVDIKTTL